MDTWQAQHTSCFKMSSTNEQGIQDRLLKADLGTEPGSESENGKKRSAKIEWASETKRDTQTQIDFTSCSFLFSCLCRMIPDSLGCWRG